MADVYAKCFLTISLSTLSSPFEAFQLHAGGARKLKTVQVEERAHFFGRYHNDQIPQREKMFLCRLGHGRFRNESYRLVLFISVLMSFYGSAKRQHLVNVRTVIGIYLYFFIRKATRKVITI